MTGMPLMFLLGLAACGGGKDEAGGGGTVALDCKGAACFKLKCDLAKFSPDEGKGAYFAKKSSDMLLQIVDSKSDQSLSLETKKRVEVGKTYSLGGTSDSTTTDFQLGSFSHGTYGSETVEKPGTVKIISLPKGPSEPVVVEVHVKFSRLEESGQKGYSLDGVAAVHVFVGE